MSGAEILQVLLAVNLVGQFCLALFYLSRRRLAWHEYLGWGLVALIFPVLGPFVVIASRPGERRRRAHLRRMYAAESRSIK